MNFERLHVYRSGDEIRASIEFNNELGSVKLALDEQMTQEVLRVCSDALVRVSKQAADEMTVQILDGMGLKLPGKTDG